MMVVVVLLLPVLLLLLKLAVLLLAGIVLRGSGLPVDLSRGSLGMYRRQWWVADSVVAFSRILCISVASSAFNWPPLALRVPSRTGCVLIKPDRAKKQKNTRTSVRVHVRLLPGAGSLATSGCVLTTDRAAIAHRRCTSYRVRLLLRSLQNRTTFCKREGIGFRE